MHVGWCSRFSSRKTRQPGHKLSEIRAKNLHMFLKTFGVRMGSAVTLCSLVSTYICPRQTADYWHALSLFAWTVMTLMTATVDDVGACFCCFYWLILKVILVQWVSNVSMYWTGLQIVSWRMITLLLFFSNLTIVDGNLQSFAFFYFAKFFRKMCLKCGSKLGYRALLGGIFSA